MKSREKIYSQLPLFLQDALLAMESRRIARRRYADDFFRVLDAISGREKLQQDALEAFRLQALRDNLVSAFEHTRYYRDLFTEAGFDPYRFKDPSDLQSLPLQDKEVIRENYAEIINRDYRGRQFTAHTSGTTGSGFIFPQTVTAEHHQWATWWRYRISLGLTITSWCSVFGGRTIVAVRQRQKPFWKVLPGLNQVSYSMYHLNPENARDYMDDLNKRKIGWIHGYPSTLSALASLMLEQNLSLGFRVKIITTGAENLLDHQRSVIAAAFGTEPYQHYGLAEPVANISGCINGKLHIDEDFSYVELVPVQGEPEKFQVVGTSFTNDSLLFLRYNTRDIVTLAGDQSCPCGRNGRIVASIDGRQEDFITLKDGTRIGRLDHLFKDMVNVKEAQVKQERSGRVTFYVVKGLSYSNRDETLLNREILSRIALEDYRIIYTDHIEKTGSGKLRFVISE